MSTRPKGQSNSGTGEPGGPKAGMGIDSAYALLIGVGQSRFSDWSLPVSVRDVEELRKVLVDPHRCGYHDDPRHVRVLTNEEATRAEIVRAIDQLAKDAAQIPDSTVLVYYSGHGWRQETADGEHYYLIPHDVKPHELTDSALPAAEFVDGLRRIKAQRVLVMMDTCHAEAMAKSTDEVVPSPLTGFRQQALPKVLVDRLATGKGRAVFLSCGEDQKSWILPGDSSLSIFTQHLLEALRGSASGPKDKLVKVSDLIDHLSEQVPASARGLGKEQNPQFNFGGENFPIALNRGGKQESAKDPAKKKQKVYSRDPGASISVGDIDSGRDTIMAKQIRAGRVGG